MKIVTADQMRKIDEECLNLGLTTSILMENAGKGVAEETRRILGNIDQQHVLVLAGPGNNGGDGLVAARYLNDWGARVSLYLFGERQPEDPNLKLVQQRNLTIIKANQDENLEELNKILLSATAVIDALFGTGKSRPLDESVSKVLIRISEIRSGHRSLHVIALDLPSGLNADTGEVDPFCLYADDTITLGYPKLGMVNLPGAESVGKLSVVDIGIPPELATTVTAELMDDEWARAVLPGRPFGANKGSFGSVLVIAGSINYIGAAYLACNGALRAGAGLVTLATTARLQAILASKMPEVTYLPLPESRPGIVSPQAARIIQRELDNYNVVLIGCGLGQSQPAIRFIKTMFFKLRKPPEYMVVDADAINTLAQIPNWWQQLTADIVLTPHPGEMARLSRVSVAEVQADRVGIARDMAREWQKTIVLKGAYTVIVNPEGNIRINPVANPGLASAGTGDVLAGVISGLVAQGLNIFDAGSLGAYIHGKAGEIIKSQLGNAGMMASDILPAIPLAVKQIKESPIKQ
jgi:hydroxyethylthiazole kinase-like uncharacterized protein yjeF